MAVLYSETILSFVRNHHIVFSPAFGVVRALDFGYANKHVVVFHFNLHFSNDI